MLTKEIIDILLQERTTETTLNINPSEVFPRYQKISSVQKNRTKDKAEVFTPVSIVKKMNDNFDSNFEGNYFDYITRKCLEVTCGEAPFLTTRYDAATGEDIPVKERVGLLDRKLQHIPNQVDIEVWINLANTALTSTYGYEWQEDSIFLARENLLLTTIEHYMDVFKSEPEFEVICNWAVIISYNIFRMDGITMCIPETDTPALVMNWETNQLERFDGKVEEKGLW